VSTPHARATDAAAAVFERGGNAIDAALVAATTLAVVYPHMCGVGGDLFALVHQPDGHVMALNASGRAPAGADLARARAVGHGSMPTFGPNTVTVPGAVSGWEALHRSGATVAWADLFEAAVTAADAGVAVSSSLAATLSGEAARLQADPGLRTVFFDTEARPLREGMVVRQPQLAQTLRAIAADGADTWYRGPTGARYVAGLAALGVPMTTDDLAAHTVALGAPLRHAYRGLDIVVHPPNSPGFSLLQILSLIERTGTDPDPYGPGAALMARIFATAWNACQRYLADPDAMLVDPAALLGDDAIDALAATLGRPAGPPAPGRRASGDTIAIVTADRHGRAVSLIQSLFDGFGSGLLEPSTGVVAQNRGACFTLDADHVNFLAPGKRPAHTLTPVMVQRAGQVAGVAGSMGGLAQPQINATTLLRTFDLAQDPATAVRAPRWLIGGADAGEGPLQVIAEGGVPGDVVRALRHDGFVVNVTPRPSSAVGHAHLITCSDTGFRVGCDPRSDGSARAG
jgi:gamma-glutamyltranspeptidase